MTRTVKSGDTLSKIAKDSGITLAQLLDANPQFKSNPNALKVGDQVVIPENGAETSVQPQSTPVDKPQTVSSDKELGKLSSRFETSNRGPGTVSGGQGDKGGVSYGSYQMSSKLGVVGAFVTRPDFPFRDRFKGLMPGSSQFTSVWKQIAATQPDEFQESQHAFIKETHFDKLVAKIKLEDKLDITTRSHALQDVIWSTAVQHGGMTPIPHVALKTLNIKPDNAEFDKRLIVAIYAERGRKANGVLVHFSGNSAKVQQGVANRFVQEQKDALKMLENEK